MVNRTLLQTLADGEFHSGEALGEILGVSRAAVWKQLQKLEEIGIPLNSVKGRGYRLQDAVELLDQAFLRSQLDAAIWQEVSVALVTGSTNEDVQHWFAGHAGRCVFFAEKQNAGRGRRGRQWVSPFARNLYFSLGWPFENGVAGVQGLSLAVGLAIYRVLKCHCQAPVALKWPNDILVNEAKLGGILLELNGVMLDACNVVIGIGLNLDIRHSDQEAIGQPATGLRQQGCKVSRAQLALELVQSLEHVLQGFSVSGFAPFAEEWNAANGFHGREVRLILPSSEVTGICQGVNEKGELCILVKGVAQYFNAGEVSLRLADVT
ncbi:MAG: bifunctional biotin--[acetyl-CoA-carboxylase] ligase/biotin operon repressor BirA [Oceanospirillaceae bacterium]|nr:bifunctional biotin--[acetyl-CoA-carboxylase] ligase/biotin operon repressor BirA [Oceanospirillaceae bacterium]MCP5350935.1 bifunctional biotin--[acetyl-CoA-carboxylase] ligase/biotin operon repressor BirA [Oceanospirillaceae bacterium]